MLSNGRSSASASASIDAERRTVTGVLRLRTFAVTGRGILGNPKMRARLTGNVTSHERFLSNDKPLPRPVGRGCGSSYPGQGDGVTMGGTRYSSPHKQTMPEPGYQHVNQGSASMRLSRRRPPRPR